MADVDAVRRVIKLNGGRLVGKTRLQKSAYFLESNDVGFGFEFEYYYYGPYSEELASLSEDANDLRLVQIQWDTSFGGAEYAIFIDTSEQLPSDPEDRRRSDILHILQDYTSTELELAATADFLTRAGYAQAWEETARRKSSKVTPERVAHAKALLRRLEL
jgi:uncharacterized protein YwgA